MKPSSRRDKKRKRTDEAIFLLSTLGLPPGQQNERSALTLLALLDLKPKQPWAEARARLIGVTPIMEFMLQHYGKQYAPNSRETVRRFTLHQFVQGGIVARNPDKPDRATNSPNNVYQIEDETLNLLRRFGKATWPKSLREYLEKRTTLRDIYASARTMERIPLQLRRGTRIALSAGGQNVLVKAVIEEFCPRFTPGALPVYVGDTDNKWAFFDAPLFGKLGCRTGEHGKIPDVVVYLQEKNWLVLIEAVTSHGPMNPKRVIELQELLSSATAAPVFVTAFLDTKTFVRYAGDIAWETEVWIAENPSHMIHFNGERFLGPYPVEPES